MRQILLLLSIVLLRPQVPVADTTFYSVAYVDIAPSSRAAAIAGLKQYREASRKEPGFKRMEFFEQVGKPGHFLTIETWSSGKAFDTHAASQNSKDYRSKIDSMRLSDYDQRPYKTLTLSPARNPAANGTMFVITHVDIGGQDTNAADLLTHLAETSRKEPGNLRFDILQHTMKANHFTVIEEWQSARAVDAHAAAAHTREYRNSLAPIAGSPLDERFYKFLE
ncbi:MAG TPA: antibiotic biosynthesis monooxygenase [Terriglobia bacterium]|jgi:autoinducer 2-degrading protein